MPPKKKQKNKSSSPVLSILIPAYNEQETIATILKKIKQVKGLPKYEIIVIDDASSDDTPKILKKHKKQIAQIITHPVNRGKSAAIQSGIAVATGEIILIQDADLEYDPVDIPALIQPILDDVADAVYGSRFKGAQPHRIVYFTHFIANQVLTFLTDIVTNLNLSDMETGYKAIKADFLKEIEITESGFGLEPEITIKLARQKARFYEVGIRYYGRTYEDGKKITLMDGVQALGIILKHGIKNIF